MASRFSGLVMYQTHILFKVNFTLTIQLLIFDRYSFKLSKDFGGNINRLDQDQL